MDLSDFVVNHTKTPTYLTTLLRKSEDIILVHSKINEAQEDTFYKLTSVEPIVDDTTFDITGSPLKVPLDTSDILSSSVMYYQPTSWTKEEEKYYPMTVNNARKFLTDYNKETLKTFQAGGDSKPTPVWCVCDTKDERKTALMSVTHTRGYLSRYVVNVKGQLPRNHPSLEIDAMRKEHLEYVEDKLPLRQIKASVLSVYEIFASKLSSENTNVKGNVLLEVTWDRCCAQIPIDNAESTLIVQTSIGQENSAVSCFWKELILLEVYIKALSEIKTSETICASDWLPSRINLQENVNLISRIIDEVNNSHVPRHQSPQGDLYKIVETVDERHTFDITDRLWNLLSLCSTCGSLTDCIHAVFTEIAYNEQVFVADSNMSTMAQLMRGIAAGKMAVPRLTGTQPIEMLIDIGLEKLRKDYTHVFVQGGLADLQEINEIFSSTITPEVGNVLKTKSAVTEKSKRRTRASIFPEKPVIECGDIEKRMKTLGLLHTVLEIVISVPSDVLQYASKTAFDYYLRDMSPIDSFATLANNKFQELRIPLPIGEVYKHVEENSPVSWILTLSTVRPTYLVQSVFHLSQYPIFPPNIYTISLSDETIMESKEVYYHYTRLTHLIDILHSKEKLC